MLSRIALVLSLHVFLCTLEFQPSEAKSWFKIGYWYSGYGFPISDINSALYTHLICAFAHVNNSSYELSISPSNYEQRFSDFTSIVKLKNPSITTLLSIGGYENNNAIIKSMISNASSRKPFIQSSIRIARLYGFQGLDLFWSTIETSTDADNLGQLFQEWRAAAKSEAETNSTLQELILTAAVRASPDLEFAGSYLVESIRSNLNWIHVNAYGYHTPWGQNFTAAPSALYDPANNSNTDYNIKAWIGKGLAANKLILCLPLFGYAWELQNPNNNAIGAPATGPAGGGNGTKNYNEIKTVVQRDEIEVLYNDTYVTNYCSFGSTWIGFDDVEAVQKKVSYAREKGLLGYCVWAVSHDDDKWTLTRAASAAAFDKEEQWKSIVIILSITATLVLMLGVTIYYQRKRIFKSKGMVNATRHSQFEVNKEAAGPFHGDAPDLYVYRFFDIEAATDKFSYENKLGQGGYGPVYKGILPDGQEIAVK